MLTTCSAPIPKNQCPAVEANHILTQATTSKQFKDAKDTAEVILTKLSSGESFNDLASQYGSNGTKDKGGNLGWFRRGMMVQPFEDSCFNATIDKPFIVTTQFGVHVVNVTGKKTFLVTNTYQKQLFGLGLAFSI